ncbi:MAG: hypothetical protein AB7T38_01150 [Nitrospirales bacterium]
MGSDMSEVDRWLEQLTQKACESAKNGRWDEVIAYYGQRSQGRVLDEVSPSTAKMLLDSDQWIVGRVKEAYGALQQQILAIQDQKRKLAVVKRQYGNPSSSGYSHHLQTI